MADTVAITLLHQGVYDEAIALLEQQITAVPTLAIHYWYLGLAWLLQEDEATAHMTWFSGLTASGLDQDQQLSELVNFLHSEASYYLEAGGYKQAEQIYQQLLSQAPERIETHQGLATALIRQGKLDQALDIVHGQLEQEPNRFQLFNLLAEILIQKGQIELAISCCHQAIHLEPQSAEAFKLLGNALLQQGKFDEAGVCYQKAIDLDPNYAAAHNNLGIIFEQQNQLEAAIACYQKVLTIDPDYISAHNNLACVLEELGSLEQALLHYNWAIAIDPGYASAHFNRSLLLLRLANFTEGFAEFEWRWQQPGKRVRQFSQPLWDGSDLTGQTILLHAEQGLGDTIQFIRYAPLVAERGGRVIVECQAPLMRLLQSIKEVEQWIPQGQALPDFDVYAPLLSLPRIFHTTLDQIPHSIPYLQANPSASIDLHLPSANRLKVGIVWAGNPEQKNDRRRSCPLQHFIRLLEMPDIDFYSLQKGPKTADLLNLPDSLAIYNLDAQLQDFADTAAALTQLDLLITVDTAIAHLAGALGCPVWVLLCFMPDWRWMIDRADSPWYPNVMRLFRQQQPGDWSGVMEKVSQALRSLQNSRLNEKLID